MNELADRALLMAAHFADAVSGQDLDETLRSLTSAAVELLPGAEDATISIRHADGSLRSYAQTSEVLVDLDTWQYEAEEGPCYDGVTQNAFTVSADLHRDARYPAYGPRAAAAGIRSQAGIRVFESQRSVGGLNLYARSPGALADVAFLTELFSEHGRSAVAYASQIDGLREAITTRQLIGQAVGIVMERFELSEDRAFAFLTRLSNDQNVKLRTVAQAVVDDHSSQSG